MSKAGVVAKPFLAHLKKVVARGQYVILDTETTGLDQTAQVVQMAIVDKDGHGLMDRLIKPTIPIPPDATKVHGITTEEAVKDGSRWENEFRYMMSGLNTKGTPAQRFDLIIYNAQYDTRMIVQTCKAHAVDSAEFLAYLRENPPACAMMAFAEYAEVWNDRHKGWQWWKLTDACDREGIKVEGAHDALGDCLMTHALIRKLTCDVKAENAESVPANS